MRKMLRRVVICLELLRLSLSLPYISKFRIHLTHVSLRNELPAFHFDCDDILIAPPLYLSNFKQIKCITIFPNIKKQIKCVSELLLLLLRWSFNCEEYFLNTNPNTKSISILIYYLFPSNTVAFLVILILF